MTNSGTTYLPNWTHGAFCTCFDCKALPDDRVLALRKDNADDILLDINNMLGFGVKPGDTIETTKVVLLYDGKGGVKAIVPPQHFTVFMADKKFLTFASKINAPVNGQYTEDLGYRGYFINNDPSTYIVIPALMKKTVQVAQKTEQAVKDVVNTGLDFFGDLKQYVKYGLIIIGVILVIVLISKFR